MNAEAADVRATARRIAIVEDDAEMAALFEDLVAEQGMVAHVRGMTSLAALAATTPDVIVLGLSCMGSLSPWHLVELIRQHRSLRTVPVIVTMLDVAAAMRDGHLSAYRGVHAVEMPCDVELIQGLVARIQPFSAPTATRSIALRGVLPSGRLPDVCPHGYATASAESCRVCRAAGTEFAMASLGEPAPYADR